MRGRFFAHCVITLGILVLGLNGCKTASAYKKNAGNAISVANDVIAAIKGGTFTYGDYDRLNSQIKKISDAVSTCPKSTDDSESSSQRLFDSSWGLFESRFTLLGSMKFLDEKLRTVGDGGVSPAYTAQVGVDEIHGLQDAFNSLQDAYKDLR